MSYNVFIAMKQNDIFNVIELFNIFCCLGIKRMFCFRVNSAIKKGR